MHRKEDSAYMVDLTALKEGRQAEFDYRITEGFFRERGIDSVLSADVDVHLTVSNRHGAYMLLFECDGWLGVPCDRCLEEVRTEVGADYETLVRYGEVFDDSAEDVLVIPQSWTSVDAAPMICDTLLLSIPIRCVHPEGECNEEMAGKLREHGC